MQPAPSDDVFSTERMVAEPNLVLEAHSVRARPRASSVAIALLAVYVVWGSTYLAIRLAIESVPPFLQASIRFLVAGLILYAVSALRGQRGSRRASLREWGAAAVVGLGLLAIGNGGVSWSEQYVPTGTAALIIATVPVWMAVLARVFWKERLHWLSGVGIFIGLVGMALLVWPHHGGTFNVGVPVLFVAALGWAAGSVYARGATNPAAPGMGAAMQMIVGGAVLLVVSVATGDLSRVHFAHLSVTSVAALAYLVVFGSIVAYSCYAWLLRNADTTLVSTYAYVNPVVAVALGALFLGEQLSLRVAVAAAVILVGVALIVSPKPQLSTRRRRPTTVDTQS